MRRHGERLPTPLEQEQPGEQQREDGHAVGMERLPRHELQRRVGEIQQGERQPVDRIAEVVPTDAVHGIGAGGERQHHRDVEDVGTEPEPVEGHEQVEAEVRVEAPLVQAADRDEGVLEARQQVHRLVVDAEVERVGAEVVLALDHEHREHEGPRQHERGEHPAHTVARRRWYSSAGRSCPVIASVARRHHGRRRVRDRRLHRRGVTGARARLAGPRCRARRGRSRRPARDR